MGLLRSRCMIALATAVVFVLPVRPAPEAARSKPATDEAVMEKADKQEGPNETKPFFNPDLVFPERNWRVPLWTASPFSPSLGLQARWNWSGATPASGPTTTPSYSGGESPGRWGASYVPPPFQWSPTPGTPPVLSMQVYNAWRAARTTVPSTPWLPGMGGTSQGDICNPIAHFAMLYAPMYGVNTRGPGRPLNQCFVAGTPVQLGSGQSLAIEKIEVGTRVHAGIPAVSNQEIQPPDWRRLELEAQRPDGSSAYIVLLRSAAWVNEYKASVGRLVPLAMPECGFAGPAVVRTNCPCPSVCSSAGRIVTGTICHQSATILQLHIKGLPAPIGTTASHRFWSEDRQSFVRAAELVPGELLRGSNGLHAVVRLEAGPGAEPVFNLEIQGAPGYRVSPLGILVHDASAPSGRG